MVNLVEIARSQPRSLMGNIASNLHNIAEAVKIVKNSGSYLKDGFLAGSDGIGFLREDLKGYNQDGVPNPITPVSVTIGKRANERHEAAIQGDNDLERRIHVAAFYIGMTVSGSTNLIWYPITTAINAYRYYRRN
jgi:hypothetical protein